MLSTGWVFHQFRRRCFAAVRENQLFKGKECCFGVTQSAYFKLVNDWNDKFSLFCLEMPKTHKEESIMESGPKQHSAQAYWLKFAALATKTKARNIEKKFKAV